MPGLVKIGKTTRDDPQVQVDELYTTGVPVPFDCIKAVLAIDTTRMERTLQMPLVHIGSTVRRDFEIKADQAAERIDFVDENTRHQATPRMNLLINNLVNLGKRIYSTRLTLNHSEMSIPKGSLMRQNKYISHSP